MVDVDGTAWSAAAVVLTTGTFLDGVIFRGDERIAAGRHGEAPAIGLSRRLYDGGFAMGRLKTGHRPAWMVVPSPGPDPRARGEPHRQTGHFVQHKTRANDAAPAE